MAQRQGEPALVLTPPDKPANADDDGLLMASEIAALKLNADWVVLSACNTAAGEEIGAQALSGLARAFFYAGGRALLVSHWPVYSDAAVRLTTSAFAELERNPKAGRAEALQQRHDRADGRSFAVRQCASCGLGALCRRGRGGSFASPRYIGSQIISRPTSRRTLLPHSASVMSSSLRMISSAKVTPSRPKAPRP